MKVNSNILSKVRLFQLKYFFWLLFCLLFIRLCFVSFSGYFKDFQSYSHENEHLIKHNIVDRNNKVIALNIPSYSIYLTPDEIKDKKLAAIALSNSLNIPIEKANHLVNSTAPFVWVKYSITKEEETKLRYYGIVGIHFQKGQKRFYPYGSLFSHIIGMVDIDNNGISGVEKKFQDDLLYKDLTLSLDVEVQKILYNALEKALKNNQAKGAYGIISDAKTSEVLALVSLPDYDPNDRKHIKVEDTFNYVTQGVIEAGSVMKVFSLAIALDSGNNSINDIYDVSKPIVKDSYLIVDVGHIEGTITVPEILMYSSNIGASILMKEVGISTQYRYLKKFNLFEPTSLEILEKQEAILPSKWDELTSMTISYGYGVGISIASSANAFSSMINGGVYRPYTLLKVNSEDKLNAGTRVISEETSRQLRGILRLVVSTGSGKAANVKGYNVGGKTGSADKIIHGKYNSQKILSSFIAFFPAEDPKYVISIVVDEPAPLKYNRYSINGGEVSAPAVAEIIENLGINFGISKDQDNADLVRKRDKDAITTFVKNMPNLYGK